MAALRISLPQSMLGCCLRSTLQEIASIILRSFQPWLVCRLENLTFVSGLAELMSSYLSHQKSSWSPYALLDIVACN